jgi:aryl-alcohol dehydrogenase-like predicted oxidoreductase
MEQPAIQHVPPRDGLRAEYEPLYRQYGLGTTIWSPLASGFLTGKYNEGIPEDSRVNLDGYDWLRRRLESERGQEQLAKVRQLTALAEELGTNTARLAIAWTLKNPNVSTVITGASRTEQIHDNMKAVDVVEQLDDEVMARIEEILDNKPEGPQSYL